MSIHDVRAQFCAAPQSHTEKENLPVFVLVSHSLVSRSCSNAIWTTFGEYAFVCSLAPAFHAGSRRVGDCCGRGCLRGPCAERQRGPPSPSAGPWLTLSRPGCDAQAVLWLHGAGWAFAVAMRCLAWWQPCQACLRAEDPLGWGGHRERGPEHRQQLLGLCWHSCLQLHGLVL